MSLTMLQFLESFPVFVMGNNYTSDIVTFKHGKVNETVVKQQDIIGVVACTSILKKESIISIREWERKTLQNIAKLLLHSA